MTSQRDLYHKWRDTEGEVCLICGSKKLRHEQPTQMDPKKVYAWSMCLDCDSDWSIIYTFDEITIHWQPPESSVIVDSEVDSIC